MKMCSDIFLLLVSFYCYARKSSIQNVIKLYKVAKDQVRNYNIEENVLLDDVWGKRFFIILYKNRKYVVNRKIFG